MGSFDRKVYTKTVYLTKEGKSAVTFGAGIASTGETAAQVFMEHAAMASHVEDGEKLISCTITIIDRATDDERIQEDRGIVLVRADDWEGLYINGELVEEGHSVGVSTVMKKIGINMEERWCDDNWLYERGRLPKQLKDVVFGG